MKNEKGNMPAPDFENAKQYVLKRLENELSPLLIYHGLAHTRDYVLPAVENLARLEGVSPEALLLLRTAALYHDIGYIEQYEDNEIVAVRIAEQTLPGFGYSPAQIQIIGGLIMATRVPQSPTTALQEIMADADLDSLGRDDFWELSETLRLEQEIFLHTVSDVEWNKIQLEFLQGHHYFTGSARKLRETKKQQHINNLLALQR